MSMSWREEQQRRVEVAHVFRRLEGERARAGGGGGGVEG